MRRTADDNDPIMKEIEPIVHSIWAEGITRGIHRKTCLWMYIVALVLEPLGLLILIGKRIIPIILLVGIYSYFSDLINKTHPHLSELLLSFGILFILLKDLEKMVIDVCLEILVVLSAGSFLVWLGKGYERNAVLFNKFISSSYGKSLIAASSGYKGAVKPRDIVAKRMTPSQLEKAQDLARECVRKKYKGCGQVNEAKQKTAKDGKKEIRAVEKKEDTKKSTKYRAAAKTEADFQKGDTALNNGDWRTALREFRPLAEQGHADAQSRLGFMYQVGWAVQKDYKTAMKWYRLAAEQGNASAHFNLGNTYRNGDGVLQDYVRAYMWFNIAASSGDHNAIKYRDIVAKRITPADTSAALKLARECVAKKYKGC